MKRKKESPLKLLLYYKPTCPFCRRVLDWLEENKMEIPLRNTHEDGVREELREIAGKTQVPCLLIDGKPLHESADIIRFLEDQTTT